MLSFSNIIGGAVEQVQTIPTKVGDLCGSVVKQITSLYSRVSRACRDVFTGIKLEESKAWVVGTVTCLSTTAIAVLVSKMLLGRKEEATLQSSQVDTPRSTALSATIEEATLQSSQVDTPRSTALSATIEEATLQSSQVDTPRSAALSATIEEDTLQSSQVDTPRSAALSATIEEDTLQSSQVDTPRSAASGETVTSFQLTEENLEKHVTQFTKSPFDVNLLSTSISSKDSISSEGSFDEVAIPYQQLESLVGGLTEKQLVEVELNKPKPGLFENTRTQSTGAVKKTVEGISIDECGGNLDDFMERNIKLSNNCSVTLQFNKKDNGIYITNIKDYIKSMV